jgi:hypothetical protein
MSNDSSKNALKIEFAPGCFDHFEGSQEDLDGLVGEIEALFGGKSFEEVDAIGQPLTEEDFDNLPDGVKEQLLAAMEQFNQADGNKKQLQ